METITNVDNNKAKKSKSVQLPPKLRKEDIYLIEEACELSGPAKQTIYTHNHNNTIQCFKRSKRLYFSKTALRKWIKGGDVS